MPRTIFHISDLHFGDEDETKIEALKDDINTYKPDIFCITGDVVNFPWPWNFRRAKQFIDYLEEKAPRRVFIVPGNHDAFFGKFGILLYQHYLRRDLQFAKVVKGDAKQGIPTVCLIGVNSTFPSLRHLWNTGRVTETRMNKLTAEIDELKTKLTDFGYRSAFKIAMLHHHPLPTVTSGADQMLYMQRAGWFLTQMVEKEINLILHGHRHDPCDFSVSYSGTGESDLMMVLSAGTTLKRLKEQAENAKPDERNFSNRTQQEISGRSHYHIVKLFPDRVQVQGMNYDPREKCFVEWKASETRLLTDPLAVHKLEYTYVVQPHGLLVERGRGTFQAKEGRKFEEVRVGLGVDEDSPDADFKKDCNFKAFRGSQPVDPKCIDLTKDEPHQKLVTITLDPPITDSQQEQVRWEYSWPGGWSSLLQKRYDRGSFYISRKTDNLSIRFVSECDEITFTKMHVTHKIPVSIDESRLNKEIGFVATNPALFHSIDYRVWANS